jgi:hypothetical protein
MVDANARAAQRTRAEALVGKWVRFRTSFDHPAFPARTYLVTDTADGMALLNKDKQMSAHPDHLVVVEEDPA